jgi:hypothetical protein
LKVSWKFIINNTCIHQILNYRFAEAFSDLGLALSLASESNKAPIYLALAQLQVAQVLIDEISQSSLRGLNFHFRSQ